IAAAALPRPTVAASTAVRAVVEDRTVHEGERSAVVVDPSAQGFLAGTPGAAATLTAGAGSAIGTGRPVAGYDAAGTCHVPAVQEETAALRCGTKADDDPRDRDIGPDQVEHTVSIAQDGRGGAKDLCGTVPRAEDGQVVADVEVASGGVVFVRPRERE